MKAKVIIKLIKDGSMCQCSMIHENNNFETFILQRNAIESTKSQLNTIKNNEIAPSPAQYSTVVLRAYIENTPIYFFKFCIIFFQVKKEKTFYRKFRFLMISPRHGTEEISEESRDFFVLRKSRTKRFSGL